MQICAEYRKPAREEVIIMRQDTRILTTDRITDIAIAATEALLLEVAATPKPGLVDRNNSGSHTDMDITTFETSAIALSPYFYRFALYGAESRDREPEDLLTSARTIGIHAEQAMFLATNGVNTHKGAIFSGGILCVAYGYLGEAANDILLLQEVCRRIAQPVMEDLQKIDSASATAGERLFLDHGVLGIRGEAAQGFPTVFQVAAPAMRRFLQQGYSRNDAGILTLIHIMAELPDTNVMHRSSYEEAVDLQKRMKNLAESGLENLPYLEILEELDREFIHRNISPGGCADLLAMTYFVLSMEKYLQLQ